MRPSCVERGQLAQLIAHHSSLRGRQRILLIQRANCVNASLSLSTNVGRSESGVARRSAIRWAASTSLLHNYGMSNLAIVLKTEIVRLARKEVRSETAGLRKTVIALRKELSAARKKLREIETRLAREQRRKRVRPELESENAGESNGPSLRVRFSAKGLASTASASACRRKRSGAWSVRPVRRCMHGSAAPASLGTSTFPRSHAFGASERRKSPGGWRRCRHPSSRRQASAGSQRTVATKLGRSQAPPAATMRHMPEVFSRTRSKRVPVHTQAVSCQQSPTPRPLWLAPSRPAW